MSVCRQLPAAIDIHAVAFPMATQRYHPGLQTPAELRGKTLQGMLKAELTLI